MKHVRHLTRLTAMLLVASASLAGAPDASMATTDGRTVAVRYDDLNLNRESGVLELYGRLVRSARDVCAIDDTRNLRKRALSRNCYATALAGAVADVDHTGLAAVHEALAGERPALHQRTVQLASR